MSPTNHTDKLDAGKPCRAHPSAPSALQPWRLPAAEGEDGRTEVEITTREIETNNAAEVALANDDMTFHRGGQLVTIITGKPSDGIDRPDNQPRIANLKEAVIRERLTKFAKFFRSVKVEGGQEQVDAHPPAWCVKALAGRGWWENIRHLSGLVTMPLLRADGSIRTEAGYDHQAELYLAGDIPPCELPDSVDRDAAVAAVSRLCDVVVDFPFESDAHRATWVAFLLTPLARHAFEGPAPLFLADANVRGSGKTLLCECVSQIIYGRDFARMTNPKDDEEARKRFTALALAGDPLILIDNIAGSLGGPALDAAMTSTVWQDRKLGGNEIVTLPLRAVWCGSGNNVALVGDMVRRVAHIRLRSDLERPEERTGFKHANLRRYILDNRPSLLADALTVLAAFIRSGMPSQQLTPWGSFDGWSDLVRNAVVWCGMPDPGETRQLFAAIGDSDALAFRAVLEIWDVIDPEYRGVSAAEILQKANEIASVQTAILEFCPARGGKLPTTKQFGRKLATFRSRVIGGRSLESRTVRGTGIWQIVIHDKTADNADEGGLLIHPANPNPPPNPPSLDVTGQAVTSQGGLGGLDSDPLRVRGRTHAREKCNGLNSIHPNPPHPPSVECNHVDPSVWVHQGGKAYCPGCDRFMGRLEGTAALRGEDIDF